MAEQFQQYLLEFSLISFLEILAVVTALIYVYLAARAKVSCFIFGFISSAIYIYICFAYKLYFDTLISIYYTVMSVVGWWMWKKPEKAGHNVAISYLGQRKIILLSIIGLLSVAILGSLAKNLTDASLPYLDSFTTVFAVIATFMLVKKQIENWIFLGVIDAASIGMYFSKELYFTSFLYLVYTIIAINGFLSWKNKYAAQNIP